MESPADHGLTLVIKPANDCNARCVYCSADREGKERMSADTLDRLFRRIVEHSPRHLVLLWHGGEPLVAGAHFYRTVAGWMPVLAERGVEAANLFQTNALLAHGEMLDLVCALSPGSIGTSVDPIPGIRILEGSPDAYLARWLDSVAGLRRRGVTVNVVYVVHKRACASMRELYFYFRNLGIGGVRFNPLYPSAHRQVPSELVISPEEWGDALLALRRAWEEDARRMRVEPVAEWEDSIRERGDAGMSCAFSVSCGRGRLGIDPQGRVYPCGRMMDRGRAPLGSLAGQSLAELLRLQEDGDLGARRDRLKAGPCGECRWQSLCKGGCPDDAEGTGPAVPSRWCAGHRRYFGEVYPQGAGF